MQACTRSDINTMTDVAPLLSQSSLSADKLSTAAACSEATEHSFLFHPLKGARALSLSA